MRKQTFRVQRHRVVAVSAAVACLAATAATHADVTVTTLATFTGPNGSDSEAPLAIDAAGNLYGTTQFGGPSGEGTAFELSGTNHQTFTTLATFNVSSGRGQYPEAGLTLDGAGNLYGSTLSGGANGGGVVFELSGPNHQTFTGLTALQGSGPTASLTFDKAGNLYGTTAFGGAHGDGSVFELAGPGHYTYSTLASFNGSNGTAPDTRLVLDPAGNLYGATFNGGANNSGVVFELSGTTHATLTPLTSFSGDYYSYSRYPTDGLTFDAAGNLYGTAESAFELSGSTHQTFSTLSTLNGLTVGTPLGLINLGTAGDLYGMTSGGDVIRMSGAAHRTLTVVAQLSLPDGSFPSAGVVADAAGTLYGTTAVPPAFQGNDEATNGDVYAVSGVTTTAYGVVLPALTKGFSLSASTAGTGNFAQAYAGWTVPAGQSGVATPAADPADRQLLILTGTGLSLAGTPGTSTSGVDLGNNDLILPAGSLAAATAEVRQGYAGGTWNGSGGISSSSAAANAARDTAIGVIQNNQGGAPLYTAANEFDGVVPGTADVLLRYTYYGDANLDGVVNGLDFSRIDAGFAAKGSLTGWYNGDFNYDGKVDGSDYTLIDDAFDTQSAAAANIAVPTVDLAAVPEPAGVTVAVVTGVSALCRRRRR